MYGYGGTDMGGSLHSGGSLYSGGGLASGGSMKQPAGYPVHADVGGQLGKSVYHQLLKMPQPVWERHREAASQMLGNRPSPMWGEMHVAPPAKGGRRSLTAIAHASTPHDMARHVEAEGRTGGDLSRAIHHVSSQVRNMR